MLDKDAEGRIVLNNERIQHWLDNGAQPTDRVLRFLNDAGLAKREARNNPKRQSRQEGRRARQGKGSQGR